MHQENKHKVTGPGSRSPAKVRVHNQSDPGSGGLARGGWRAPGAGWREAHGPRLTAGGARLCQEVSLRAQSKSHLPESLKKTSSQAFSDISQQNPKIPFDIYRFHNTAVAPILAPLGGICEPRFSAAGAAWVVPADLGGSHVAASSGASCTPFRRPQCSPLRGRDTHGEVCKHAHDGCPPCAQPGQTHSQGNLSPEVLSAPWLGPGQHLGEQRRAITESAPPRTRVSLAAPPGFPACVRPGTAAGGSSIGEGVALPCTCWVPRPYNCGLCRFLSLSHAFCKLRPRSREPYPRR